MSLGNIVGAQSNFIIVHEGGKEVFIQKHPILSGVMTVSEYLQRKRAVRKEKDEARKIKRASRTEK